MGSSDFSVWLALSYVQFLILAHHVRGHHKDILANVFGPQAELFS